MMAKAGRVQHWKHGWIPISPEAKAFVEGRGPDPTPGNGRKGVPTAPKAPEFRALPQRGMDELSPALQGKIRKKMESLTGIPEPELAAMVQKNLVDMVRNNPGQENWYSEQGGELGERAKRLGTTQERLVGMVAVTSAEKRWVENKDFAEKIAAKLQVNEPFEVTQADIDDYNRWSTGRAGVAKPHPELKPGTYRPSDLPADFAASKTPGMPKAKNTDAVIKATRIYRGEASLDDVVQGPKQRSFINNLMDPADKRFVTVDVWHYRAAMKGIPVTRTVKGQTFTYTLEQWEDRDLARADGRAVAAGYDPSKPLGKSGPNLDALKKAADNQNPQTIFQGSPSSVAENYDGAGTYPWFVLQTQKAAEELGMSPNAVQADAWYAVGGGL